MADTFHWRAPYTHFNAVSSNFFNQHPQDSQHIDFLNPGETHIRTLATCEAYFRMQSTLPQQVDRTGWWEDELITVGLYIFGIPGASAPPVTPIAQSSDDQWLFTSQLVIKNVTLAATNDSLDITYGFPQNVIDVTARRANPSASLQGDLQICWDWSQGFVGYEDFTTSSLASFLGMRFHNRSLYLQH